MAITMGELASRYAAASRTTPGTQEMRQLAQIGVGLVKSEIQAMHAVDTGTMLNSTDAEQVSKTTWLIGPTVTYAPFVALGTSRVRARPFHIEAAKKLSRQVDAMGFDADKLGI